MIVTLKRVLVAMQRGPWTMDDKDKYNEAIEGLGVLIAQLKNHEPVAWMQVEGGATRLTTTKGGNAGIWEPLYAHPSTACTWPKGRCACDELIYDTDDFFDEPAPTVPDAKDYTNGLLTMQEQLENNAYVNGWNECREEMLSAAPEYRGEK